MSRSGTTQADIRQRRATGAKKARISFWRRRFVRVGVIFALIAGAAFWLGTSGVPQRIAYGTQQKIYKITAAHGFAIHNVLVQGRVNTDADVLRGLINVTPGDPILAFDPNGTRDMLERISWIKSAQVERRLPDTIYIRLTERHPLALWQNKGKLRLIDDAGVTLTDTNLQKFSSLPLVVGEDAPAHATEFLSLLAAEPSLAPQVEAASWVSERRWDLTLKGGITVELPPVDPGLALHRLAAAQADNALLDKDISMVDLREPDRMTVRTKPGAVKDLKASLATRNNI
jgi:cell division protein FtsQ